MATTLAAQLSVIATNSENSLNLKALKARHSKSLIYEPRIAASQNFETIYTICHEGFRDLCLLDNRYLKFQNDLFHEQSLDQDRTQMTAEQNVELDTKIEDFLGLISRSLRLAPAIKAIEWLVRRFRINECNISITLQTFLPYHSLPIFTTLLSILSTKIPEDFKFLQPYIRSLTNPPRSVIVQAIVNNISFASTFNTFVLNVCKKRYEYPSLVAFWAGIMTEATSSMFDRARSGRNNIQLQNEQDVILRILPILQQGLALKDIPNLRVGCFMLLTVIVSKGSLNDKLLTALMETVAFGWTNETGTASMVCLSLMAEHRGTKKLTNKLTKELTKDHNFLSILIKISKQQRVDKLINSISLSILHQLKKSPDIEKLSLLQKIIECNLLKSSELAVIFQSLISIAHQINEAQNEARSHLARLIVTLNELPGHIGTTFRTIISETQIDMDELEQKLQTSIRLRLKPEVSSSNDLSSSDETQSALDHSVTTLINQLPVKTNEEVSFLSQDASQTYSELCHVFIACNSTPESLKKFDEIPILQKSNAGESSRYLSFYMRTWCSPHPVATRTSAIRMATVFLSENESQNDFQAIIPYAINALGDPATKVRKGAVNLLLALGKSYSSVTMNKNVKKRDLWGTKDIYGSNNMNELNWLPIEVAAHLVNEVLIPVSEEFVLDKKYIESAFQNCLNSRANETSHVNSSGRLSQSSRMALLSFLASQITCTPLFAVKQKLITCANQARNIGSTTRTKYLFSALQSWVSLTTSKVTNRCQEEYLDLSALEESFLMIVTPKSDEGIRYLISIIQGKIGNIRPSLEDAVYKRIETIWTSLSRDLQRETAEALLVVYEQSPSDDEKNMKARERVTEILHKIPLSTEILLFFLSEIPTSENFTEITSSSKRRRTCHGEIATGEFKDPIAIRSIILKITFILQLVDDSEPGKHPEILGPLFNVLAQLRELKSMVASEFAYLQSLALGCIFAILKTYETNRNLEIDGSAIRTNLLVDCVQKTASLQVQNAALLVISSLAHTVPQLVLHSVMPIFTFMGSSILQQDDEYSAHVINQTIRKVIPPLIASLRREKGNLTTGVSELLLSFVAAYEHIPSHRRKELFLLLIHTLGPEDFLFTLLAMLVEKYGYTSNISDFAIEIFGAFTTEVQLKNIIKYVELVADVLKPNQNYSWLLLNINDGEGKDASQVAHTELSLLPNLLTQKQLISKIGKTFALNDIEAEKVRQIYSNLVEKLLAFSDSVRHDEILYSVCGTILENTLGLLSTCEFLNSVKCLLERPNESLRRKILRSLEFRVEKEKSLDVDSRVAMLGFLPQLTTIIRESQDILYKQIAVSCVEKMSRKYGKKDLEAFSTAAETISSIYCLGQPDYQLRISALKCLASLIDTLREGIISILPVAMPKALEYLEESMRPDSEAQMLHRACYLFISELSRHLPYMISGAHLNKLIEISNTSATAKLDEKSDEVRKQCLSLAAKQINPKNIFCSLEKYWSHAILLGPSALRENINCLHTATTHHSKSIIVKNSSVLAKVIKNALDIRRFLNSVNDYRFTKTVIDEIECDLNGIILEMIYKLNDATFRPIFVDLVEWTAKLPKEDVIGKMLRQLCLFKFLIVFFDKLKSIVTSYASYLLEDSVKILNSVDPQEEISKELWSRVLRTLTKSFEHDQDEFWQSPAHFNAVAPVLSAQIKNATSLPLNEELIPALVELASVSESPDHHKELNFSILKHVRSENSSIRLAAVICQQKLTERLGEEWLSMLPEMLPIISELQEDDDELVEKETHRWIVKIEEVLGESLDSMLH
ncbi:U3 small nucleolar RNA-associated protein 10 [Golovinomyces cichoracearum]|uniref:U3 small nucleolar RNA-associated protein 10 n=1 Tax=Golovinomyces cichoracearum TaxID=62708 RepID=A0A420H9W5_9PEZI|nr:U3 small nucleolar RNA-associated protein 10 [Golovinomyces cichoracearum]